jgi:integral membrane protein
MIGNPPDARAAAALRSLRLVGSLEGISFLLLLLVAMPLKYMAGMPMAVRVVGMAHGLLFLWYLVALVRAASERGWGLRRGLFAFAASVTPLGFLFLDASLRRELAGLSDPPSPAAEPATR